MLNYNFLINPFSSDMHISPTIHHNAGVIGVMETGLPTGSIMKYNFFVN